jgi:hypothetical protein
MERRSCDQRVDCKITNQDFNENLEIAEKTLSLCSKIANFKISEDWISNWSEAKFPYVLGENPGDFSSMDGIYKYAENEE